MRASCVSWHVLDNPAPRPNNEFERTFDWGSGVRLGFMAGASTHSNGSGRAARGSEAYDRKLEAILRQAAAVFRNRGYHQASMRDIARATGVSLAGLYYYFSSKEDLLYLIQRHAFETILAAARAGLAGIERPENRLRALIGLHLRFFLEHPNEMKVLTHEEEWLSKERGREVRGIKRAYYQLCFDQVEQLCRERGLKGLNTRLTVLSLFGMMNWIYTWYNPGIDPDAEGCARAMAGIFLDGVLGSSARIEPSRSLGGASPSASNGRSESGVSNRKGRAAFERSAAAESRVQI
ncbi:MAG TPA: TetR/AcrR family transcriptional regulator [Terriglobia bacterium]|nr:TetR/AcrR family transcriptional regulator [Terriglobia bacterium]